MTHPERVTDYLEHIADAIERAIRYVGNQKDPEALDGLMQLFASNCTGLQRGAWAASSGRRGAALAAVFTGYVSSLKSISNTLARREPSWVKSANAAR